jgi:hypothetical protein
VFASNYLASTHRKRSLTIGWTFVVTHAAKTKMETLNGLGPSTTAIKMDGNRTAICRSIERRAKEPGDKA